MRQRAHSCSRPREQPGSSSPAARYCPSSSTRMKHMEVSNASFRTLACVSSLHPRAFHLAQLSKVCHSFPLPRLLLTGVDKFKKSPKLGW